MTFIFIILVFITVVSVLYLKAKHAPQRATTKLIHLCKEKGELYWHPSLALVTDCVRNGADVSVRSPLLQQPVLCHFVKVGAVECIEACLATLNVIDFTVKDAFGDTPLHTVCSSGISNEMAHRILWLFVFRLETHPRDVADWKLKNNRGDDFCALAAGSQQLSLLWPLVRHLPAYADLLDPLPLSSRVWQWDWERLSVEDRKCFAPPSTLVVANEPTATLFKMSASDFPVLSLVQECVQQGADVLFHPPDSYWPILHRFLFAGEVDCVAACMESPQSIDFTVVDRYKCTPLHLVCHNGMDNKVGVAAILSHILHRLATHSEDVVNWSQKNDVGLDFISHAAASERLSLVWPLVKHAVPYFRNYSGKIPLCAPVYRSDWNALTTEEQARLEPLKGFE